MAVRADDVDLGRDRALVELYQAGDEGGFEDLYRRYYARLYRYCLKRVGDPHAAEEVTQEAFARAYTALPRLTGERRFYPWLSVIAHRLCVDHHRRAARTEPSDDIDLGSVEGGQDAVFDAVDRDLVHKALARVGPRHREVLHLREEEGWSYQRIAEYYEVSLGAVEQLLLRARRALKREFLAVSAEPKGLAAVPVLGWLLRRVNAARVRGADFAAQAAPTLANAAVSLVVVAGSATALSAATNTPSTKPVAPAPALSTVQLQTPAPNPAPPAAVTPEGSVEAPATAPRQPAPRPKAPNPAPVQGKVGEVEATNADQAKDSADGTVLDFGRLGASADANQAVNEVHEFIGVGR